MMRVIEFFLDPAVQGGILFLYFLCVCGGCGYIFLRFSVTVFCTHQLCFIHEVTLIVDHIVKRSLDLKNIVFANSCIVLIRILFSPDHVQMRDFGSRIFFRILVCIKKTFFKLYAGIIVKQICSQRFGAFHIVIQSSKHSFPVCRHALFVFRIIEVVHIFRELQVSCFGVKDPFDSTVLFSRRSCPVPHFRSIKSKLLCNIGIYVFFLFGFRRGFIGQLILFVFIDRIVQIFRRRHSGVGITKLPDLIGK